MKIEHFLFGTLLVGLLCLQGPAVQAADPEPLIRDDYTGELAARRATRGPWKIADGMAVCTQDDELFKKFKDHGPVIWYDAQFTDAVIKFTFKPEKAKTFVFTVNGPNGHVFRFISSERGTTVVAFPPSADHKSKPLDRGGPKLSDGQWTPVTVELRGTKAVVQIGDYKAEVEDPSLAGQKVVVGLGFSFGTVALKDFSLTPIVVK
ncbi:MAG: hypothetical protein JNK76_19145 [Planctomycetales bacterium]|nr:hypothetical protein [Planctomycetales bacterium]MBN8625116.1 hypothetical protein [Planctomycetota bacterium]